MKKQIRPMIGVTRFVVLQIFLSLAFWNSSTAGDRPVCSPLLFEHAETPSNHQGLWNLAIGDLDGDGDLDVVAVGIYEGGIFSVLKNQGDGSFETPTLYTIGNDPRCVLLEDLDGDSDLDLIVSNSLGGKLFVYSNPGDGVFEGPSREYEFPEGVRPIIFTVGDLDDDGDPDLAVSDAYGNIPVLWNRGDGIFDPGPMYEVNSDGFLYDIVAQDLDGDGSLDLAVLTIPFDPPNVLNDQAAVVVLTNDGSGVFGNLQSFGVPFWPTLALTAADIDGDGDLDLAGVNSPNANPNPNGMWLLFNDGGGQFGAPIVYSVGPWPHDVHFADLDRDGDLDAVVPNHRFADAPPPHDVSILLNRGDGTFEDERIEIVGYKPIAVGFADVNDDGDLDVVVANFAGYGHPSSISVLSNLCDHPFLVHGESGLSFSEQAFSGYIDPRSESLDGSEPDLGIEELTLVFSEPVFSDLQPGVPPTPGDFTISQTGIDDPPVISTVDSSQNPTIRLSLDRPIALQEWTSVQAQVQDGDGHPVLTLGDLGSGQNEPDRIDVGFLPSDMDQDGVVNPLDLLRFKQYVNGILSPTMGLLEDYADMDRNGIVNPVDLLRFKQLVNGIPPATQPWAGAGMNDAQP